MKKSNKVKLTLYKIILILLLIAVIFVIMLIIQKYGTQEQYDIKNQEIVDIFNNTILNNKDLNNTEEKAEKGIGILEFEGYKVIGLIKIPAINLEYPILEKTTQATMKIAISRFWGGDINSYGNVSLAGHNNKITGTMFGKNKKLKNGDSIYLTDLTGQTIEYKIYDTFIVDPNDVKILQTTDENIREVTLITCTNGRENRLITKAREVE